MMKKVLFCTYGFPGTGGGGTFNLIKYLPRHGYEPIVITNNHKPTEMEEHLLREHFQTGLRVYRAATLPKSPFRVFSKYLRMPRLTLFLDKLVFFPDFYVLGVPASVYKAIRLIRAEGIECIVTSSPPESLHLVGLIAQKLTGCCWIAHFRDLWSTKVIVNRPATPLHARWLRNLERLIYFRTDHLIANTRGNRDIYVDTFAVAPNRMTYIPNGYDSTEVLDCVPPLPPGVRAHFRIGYMGYFDKPGFPWQGFLLALRELATTVGEQTVIFHIAGHVSPAAKAYISSQGLSSVVRLHGVVAHSDAFALMRQSDLVAVLHYETGYSRAIVPHKLYHYLGMRKPILGIGDEDGEMASIIRDANAGRVVSISRQNGIFDELLAFYRAWKSEGRIEYQGRKHCIERYEIQELTARLANTITQTLECRRLHSESTLKRPLLPTA
jgi:glycosyltransferase involved in cell wall biosynthesis